MIIPPLPTSESHAPTGPGPSPFHLGIIEDGGDLTLHGLERPGRQNRRAVLFVHGFVGRWQRTWGKFPELIAKDPELAEYDIYAVNYRSKVLRGDPIDQVGRQIDGLVDRNLAGKRLVLIAHSMGGLVGMQYILGLLDRGGERGVDVQGLLMYGTPTQGTELVRIAKWAGAGLLLWIPWLGHGLYSLLTGHGQLGSMAPASALVSRLNDRWAAHVVNGGNPELDPGRRAWLQVGVVTGTKDCFVPESSAKSIYGEVDWSPIPFGHMALNKPDHHRDTRYVIAKQFLQECTRIQDPEVLFRLRALSEAILKMRESSLMRDWEYSIEIGGDEASLPAELREAGYQRCRVRRCKYITVLRKTDLNIGITFDQIAGRNAWRAGPEYVHQITAMETDGADKGRLKLAFDRIIDRADAKAAWSTLFPSFRLSVRGTGPSDEPFEVDAPSEVRVIDGGGLLGRFRLPPELHGLVGSEVEVDIRYTSAVPRSLTTFRLFFTKLTAKCDVTLKVCGSLDFLVPPTRSIHEPNWEIVNDSYDHHRIVRISTDGLVLPGTAPLTRWRLRDRGDRAALAEGVSAEPRENDP